MAEREILNIDEAAELLGVSVKTFNKVLHSEDLPARKIGREWKFSRAALIAWVGSGESRRFYRESNADRESGADVSDEEIVPAPRGARPSDNGSGRSAGSASPDRERVRRTAGWQIED
jgi:excisionase family DNA binding protein